MLEVHVATSDTEIRRANRRKSAAAPSTQIDSRDAVKNMLLLSDAWRCRYVGYVSEFGFALLKLLDWSSFDSRLK